MNRETGAWLAVALLSISALGVSATTLESTMSTDANDVIDLDYDQVPIGQDTASKVVDEIEGNQQEGEPASSTSANPGEQRESTSSQPAEDQPPQQRQQERSQSESAETAPEMPSLLDRLLALLTALLPYLLAVAALLGAVGLAVRYRERLLAAFGDGADDDAADGPRPADADDPLDGPPAHAVERAWLGMVRHLDLDRPGTKTTSECARAAIEAGLDREAVQRLTETYEEVRYGGRPVTDQREAAAEQSQERLDVGGGA